MPGNTPSNRMGIHAPRNSLAFVVARKTSARTDLRSGDDATG